MRNRKTRLMAAVAVMIALASCSDRPEQSAQQAPAPAVVQSWKVAERYEVGKEIYVRSLMVEPARNALWVGTSAGLHEVDLGSFELRQTFTREHGLANEYVFAIGLDAEGYKWFGTNAGGVSRYKDGHWQTFFPMHGLADYWVYAFTQQKNGPFWIGTWAGANSVDLPTLKFTTYVNELVNEWVYGMGVDSKNRVWFGTEGGVSMFDGTEWRSWTHADGLGASNVEGLPPSKNTGLGTRERHDLGVLSAGSPTYNPNYVFSLWVDSQDRVWTGTWGAGVSVYDGTKWTNYTTRDGLANNIVYSVIQGKDGAFWFGTAGGVSRFDGANWQSFGVQHGLIDNNVYALAEAPNGQIWVGTKGGVVRIAK